MLKLVKDPGTKPLAELKERYAKIHDLEAAAGLLHWDQQTYLPPGSIRSRADQSATLSVTVHELAADPRLGDLLEMADQPGLSGFEQALLREIRRQHRLATALPVAFVAEFSRTTSLAHHAWESAKQAADYAQFAPHLAKVITLSRRAADYYGYQRDIYDALLDLYEPGTTTAEVRSMFTELKAGLVPLVQQVTGGADDRRDRPLHQRFSKADQLAFAWKQAVGLGFDPNRGRQDLAMHPFCTSFGEDDVRITTDVDEHHFGLNFFSTLHEMGHALYEQGVSPRYRRSPLAGGVSLGVHESQSRLWENLVGRSRPFWRKRYRRLQKTSPQLQGTSLEAFYRAINTVRRSPVRIEADELTYNLHVMIRFELEEALLKKEISIRQLPEAWNEKYHAYLGIRPANDRLGVLQDVHWSSGMVGYFPTYTIGNVLSMQIWETAHRNQEVAAASTKGEYQPLLRWLQQQVYRHGSRYQPKELVRKVTGGSLNAGPYLNYLQGKFAALYQ